MGIAKEPDRREQDKIVESGLRPVDPRDITGFLEREWDRQVRVERAAPGEWLTVEDEWHGAGKKGKIRIYYGEVLATPVAGTALLPRQLFEWLKEEKGFRLEVYGQEAPADLAALMLSSDAGPKDGQPVVRAVRTPDRGVPIIFEYYFGSLCDPVHTLSAIGNAPGSPGEEEKKRYRGAVAELLAPFISKSTTPARQRLGISEDALKDGMADDCGAIFTTGAGYLISADHHPANTITVFDVSVSTTQSMLVSLFVAEKRKTPIIYRAGAPSFGLGDENRGLNYMMNVQPEMLRHGHFTSGDFGQLMSDGTERGIDPYVRIDGTGTPLNRLHVFLNGGGPILKMRDQACRDNNESPDGQVLVWRAARIDHGPKEWGLIMTGPLTQ
jgi:hypothetical protein